MNTRGRQKPSGTSQVPVNLTEGPTVSSHVPEPVVRKSRAKTKVLVARKSKVVVTPVKKRVPVKKRLTTRGPKTKTTPVSDEESEGSRVLEDPKDLECPIAGSESEDESQLEIEQLRKKLVELEADQRSCNSLNEKRSQLGPETGNHHVLSPPAKRCNPVEGRSLGTFNGKTDLDTFLVRFETCGRHFAWSKSEKVFHLMNASTESAEPIVKEVGPSGTLEHILE